MNDLRSAVIIPKGYGTGLFGANADIKASGIKNYFDLLIPFKVNIKDFKIAIGQLPDPNSIN